MRSITDLPDSSARAHFDPHFGQRFILTVDTEEEFDWNAPFQRSGHGLDHVPHLRKFQQFCEGQQVSPIYLVDYPIATSPAAVEILRDAVASQKAEIGIQLHPWVNPPHTEDISDFNSFAGNLPADLERAKFHVLRDRIIASLGVTPLMYRAGRYGLGPGTADLLRGAGIAIDSSVRANFDYSAAGGVNFRDHPVHPYWIGEGHHLLELPLTTVFTGPLRHLGSWLYPSLWRAPTLRGVMARAGLLNRVPLTPEGVTAAEAIRGIDAALGQGLPLLVLSFHSPSLQPGHTPYVQHEADVDRMYDWWREVLGHLRQKGVRPTSAAGIMSAVAA
ncbi:WalW protein [Croceicoccus estronivorus]|uniref:polysaccharide deacetylase family protein n=1 Tax=Croceicoccus estronivorus TaxID=1172626 RepID=UPI00082CF934|nr:polysaccharide deacetylase family protein [Croceicoccus estronivorus]OCC24947.1 WalW protein [Croceicoccus estronivorus]